MMSTVDSRWCMFFRYMSKILFQRNANTVESVYTPPSTAMQYRVPLTYGHHLAVQMNFQNLYCSVQFRVRRASLNLRMILLGHLSGFRPTHVQHHLRYTRQPP